MKIIKCLISSLLCAAIVFSCCLPSFAEELTANEAAGVTTVGYTAETEFYADIPAYVIPAEQEQQTADYSVTLRNALIPDGKQLNATVEYSGTLTEENGVELPYSLYDESGDEVQSGERILSKTAGSPEDTVSTAFSAALTSKAKYAGVYSDTATFTFDLAEKTYTTDEIETSEYLYAIGKTKSEYVVAKFNEDFSEVTIFANGEDSDGLMRDFGTTNDSYSPMRNNADTLKCATILDDVTSIGERAFWGCSSLESVTIPDSVVSIGTYAFQSCTSLTSVTIGNGVTSIGGSAFCGCSSLESVTIPDSVTNIRSGAFDSCASLESVTIGNSVVCIEQYTFMQCSSLKSVTIPDSVTSIENYAFYGCKSLTSVTIGNSVVSIGQYAFKNCFSLESVTIPDSVVSIGKSAFSGCNSLTSVTIPGKVKNIATSTFYNCKSLTSVTIPDSVTSIGDSAFCECTSLESVTIPSSVNKIGVSAFEHCSSLTNVTIPDSVTSIGDNAFERCISLTDFDVDIENKYYSGYNGILFNKDKTVLICYPAKKADASYLIPDSVTSIKQYAFDYCTSLESVTIGNSVTSIGNYTFRYCTSLTSVTIPDSVTSVETSAFYKCTSLTTIYGEAGSYAETYAGDNGYTFVAQ